MHTLHHIAWYMVLETQPSQVKKVKKKQTRNKIKTTELYCLPDGCLHGHQNLNEMVQCSHCAIWFHMDCVGLDSEAHIGVWPCPRCRQQSDLLFKCHQILQEVSVQVTALHELHQEVRKDMALIKKIKDEEKEKNKKFNIMNKMHEDRKQNIAETRDDKPKTEKKDSCQW